MYEVIFSKISSTLCIQLLQGNPNIIVQNLLKCVLPANVDELLPVILLEPHQGKIRLGEYSIELSQFHKDQDQVKEFHSGSNIAKDELTKLINVCLHLRLDFILNPAKTVADIIYDITGNSKLSTGELISSLADFQRLLFKWSPDAFEAVKVVNPYFAEKTEGEISKDEFIRILSSAFVKNASGSLIKTVMTGLVDVKSLIMSLPIKFEEKLDFFEPAVSILENFGFGYWAHSLTVEREIQGGALSTKVAIEAIQRLKLFHDQGLLVETSSQLESVDDEVADFASFIEESTE